MFFSEREKLSFLRKIEREIKSSERDLLQGRLAESNPSATFMDANIKGSLTENKRKKIKGKPVE